MTLLSRLKRSGANLAYALARPAEKVVRLFPSISKSLDLSRSASQVSQLLLMQQYEGVREGRNSPKHFREVEFRAYSQNGEDGILLYIFSLIGFQSRRSVEICAGDGIECNSANLIVNHSFYGMLVDGDAARVKRGRRFYSNCRDTGSWPPVIVQAWVSAENVNSLIEQNGFAGDIDLLSIDIDGVDYWLWRAIDVIRPRVVVTEFNHLWGSQRSVTVPYDSKFMAQFGPYGADYSGASLPAMVKLGREKGYRFVGVEKYGFNAFFVREDLAESLLPEANPSDCFGHPRARFGMQKRLPNVADKPWVEV